MHQAIIPHPTTVRRWKEGAWETFDDVVSPEEAVLVRWQGGERVLWAWPHDLESLCLGHVLLDCLPQTKTLGAAALPLHTGTVQALPPQAGYAHAFWVSTAPKHCPRASLPAQCISAAAVVQRMAEFMHMAGACPHLWESTGCFHRAALFDPQTGAFLCLAEDIGRHNCLDRLVGWASMQGIDPAATILFVSARITASLYAKARRAGWSAIISRSAITSTPVCLAQAENAQGGAVTLAAFCRPREQRVTIFADAGRISA